MALFVLCAAGPSVSVAGDTMGVGMMRVVVADPLGGKAMEAAVFYPASVDTEMTIIGSYRIDAARDAAILPGRYPLVLVSHGNQGSLWGHHDTATSLARRGFVVATLTHPGDNYRDAGRIGTSSVLYGRPLQVSALLDAVVRMPAVAPFIDEERIGFIGFSAGGTTGLILAGAVPELQRLETYCADRPDDRRVCAAAGRIRNDRPDLLPTADHRIRALVLMAPLSVFFPAETLMKIRTPALVYTGERDEQLSPGKNAVALMRDLSPPSRLEVVAAAGHFVFLAPCTEQLARSAPELCIDPPGVDRRAVHQAMTHTIADFLTEHFDAKTP